ncbi:MAG: LysM peptidoglycan-binding domain-containing protein, partial [Bacteroidia bacterium]|nr:LysM peptidoglycan-binding domain-containing protein [Bacteroidia bacterium]
VGINGANFSSILQQKLMPQQLSEIDPDLVIIDLGTNEFYAGNFDAEDYEMKLRNLVHWVRKAAPKSNILLTSVQDAYRNVYHNVIESKKAAEITEKVAFSMNCGFYNFYVVSGGQYSMLKWRRHELAKNDRVHLSYKGYVTKAELFTNALLNSYYAYLKGYLQPFLNPAILPTPKFINYISSESLFTNLNGNAKFTNTANYALPAKQHIVKKGENLTRIAAHYQTTVSALKNWNRLKSDFITVGQKLWVTDPKNFANTELTSSNPHYEGPYLIHIVKPGENLYRIALQHQVKVSDIQKWNNLPNTTLHSGQKLKILSNPPLANATSLKDSTYQSTIETKLQEGVTYHLIEDTPAHKRWHIVEIGDTLWSISQKYNTTVEELKKINFLSSDCIKVGTKLLLP